MSADNVIYVQKRKDGMWWVWMDFMSEAPDPDNSGFRRNSSFTSRREAKEYAYIWEQEEAIVEYGVVELEEDE
jgi:hypothetical protein